MNCSYFFRASALLAVVALGACAGSTEVGPAGTGGANATAGTTGAAGTADTGGSSGSAGTNGTAGTGTPGTGGTVDPSGSAGTVGTAGRGGTTGTAGATGTAGRGGTTGTAGTGTAGRGGTTGTAGTGAAGRGGTTGTAGTTGTGGATACTITATSTLGMIPTVGIVTFTTNLTGITSAEIRFGPASTGPTMTAPVNLSQPSYRTLLLGMKGSTSYVYRIVANSSAGTCTSQDFTIMTGAVPSNVPTPTASIMNPTSHSKGFVVTSSGISGTGAYIYDSDGAPVWWHTMAPSGTSRIQMSWDGSKMYMMALNVQNTGAGAVKIMDMDGANATTASGMTASHHDMTAIPGGFATLLWNSSGIDAPCSLVERADSGTMKTIVANMNTLYTSNTFHTNSIHYYPSDDTYTLGDRNPNLYVKVSRSGQLIWQLGGANPKDMTKFFSGAGTWSVNHGHHMLGDSFILFNNGAMAGGSGSVVRAFKLNTANMTATSTLMYSASGVNSMVLGDAQFLPNGNILVTFSTSGQLNEITSTGTVVATFKFTALGYSEYRDSLYGPPPR